MNTENRTKGTSAPVACASTTKNKKRKKRVLLEALADASRAVRILRRRILADDLRGAEGWADILGTRVTTINKRVYHARQEG